MKTIQSHFKKHIALPPDHGSWVFLLSPLIIGLYAGGDFKLESVLLIIASLCAFLLRQPMVIAVKAIAGRRAIKDLATAKFWILFYFPFLVPSLVLLIMSDYWFVLYLAIPGVLIFIWYLSNVLKREERHHILFDIVASGVLALAAPAAYWVGTGSPHPIGWVLWVLVWAQSSASIFHAFLRLAQRNLKSMPTFEKRITLGASTLFFTSINLSIVTYFSLNKVFPPLLFLPYLLQFVESTYCTFFPAINIKPTRIGFRQLFISTLFTIIFVITI
jgi:hypothetical protein